MVSDGGPMGDARELSRWMRAMLAACPESPPAAGFRTMAVANLAIWDAVSSVEPEARPIALAAAAHEALTMLAPACQATLGEVWARSVQTFCRKDAVTAIPIAREVAAARVLRHAAREAFPVNTSAWHAFPPLLLDEAAIHRRIDNAAPRPEVTVGEIHEVEKMGGRDAPARTADQTTAAIFWCASPSVIRHAAMAAGMASAAPDLLASARLLACVAVAQSDALLVAWSHKSRVASPRPSMVIQGSIPSRLWVRSLRPDWMPLVDCPGDSEFPSEWCVALGAALGALRTTREGDDNVFDVVCPPVGLTRHFGSLSHLLQESEDARIWAGWHYRSTVVDSTEMGLRIGEEVVRTLAAIQGGMQPGTT